MCPYLHLEDTLRYLLSCLPGFAGYIHYQEMNPESTNSDICYSLIEFLAVFLSLISGFEKDLSFIPSTLNQETESWLDAQLLAIRQKEKEYISSLIKQVQGNLKERKKTL